MRLAELEGRGRVKCRNKASPFHTFILRPFSLAVNESLLHKDGTKESDLVRQAQLGRVF